MTRLSTPWTGHWREAEFFSFVKWALGEEPLRRQYREQTGDEFEPSAETRRMEEQISSGEAHAYVQRYADWLAYEVFGTPDDMGEIGTPPSSTVH